jgi:glycosyltransferase involved in cell wall biosynthesis
MSINNIVLVSHYHWSNIGGVETHTKQLFELFSKKFKTRLITTSNNKQLEESESKSISKSYRIISGYPLPGLSFLKSLFSTLFFHRGSKTLVIIQGRHFISSVLGIIVARLMCNKVLYIEHGFEYKVFKKEILKFIAFLLDHTIFILVPLLANEIVVVSNQTEVSIRKKFPLVTRFKKITVIENAVILDDAIVAILDKPLKKRKLIVFSARNSVQKNNQFVLDNFYKLAKENLGWDFLWISDAEIKYRKSLKNLRIKENLLNKKEFIDTLKQSSIYVNASSYEGLSLSILEADLLGNTLLVSDIPENRLNTLNKEYFFTVNNSSSFRENFNLARDQFKSMYDSSLAGKKYASDLEKFSKAYLDIVNKQ